MTPLKNLLRVENDAREFGFTWPDPDMVLDQVIDECREIKEDIDGNAHPDKIQEEIGDLLHAAISVCVFMGFNVEETLEKTAKKFERRLSVLKDLTHQQGLKNLQEKETAYLVDLWKAVKQKEEGSL